MAQYIIRDRVPCWVTWTYRVEAASRQEAIERYGSCDYYEDEGHGEPEIGETISLLENEIEAELIPRPVEREEE
jgi:hypothetical protein